MAHEIDQFGPGALSRFDAVIDVRSPSEFAEDHVPGAINLPVLDDAQRAEVGTIYKQVSRFRARRVGAGHVARNIGHHLATALSEMSADWHPLVYCWRGGMRSGAMATILRQVGWHTLTVKGGYKAWRRHVLKRLYEDAAGVRLVVLDGNTGTAKTALLQALKARGVQVIDLEGLAKHRGSLFGGFEGEEQPGQKLFESQLAFALDGFDPARPVLIEAESSRIGKRVVPPALWQAMMDAPVIEVVATLDVRAAHILSAYPDFTAMPERIEEVIERLRPLHSKERVAEWRELAAGGAFAELASRLMRDHYDPAYERQRRRHDRTRLGVVDVLDAVDLEPGVSAIEALLGDFERGFT